MRNRAGILQVLTLGAMCAFTAGCGDDEGNPMAPPRSEIKLAVYTSTVTSVSSVEPSQPYVAHLEFGVFDKDPASFDDPPDAVVFGDREFEDGGALEARLFDTAHLGEIAKRLTDNVDRYVYVRAQAGGVIATRFDFESLIFQYFDPTRPGPDLAGSNVTGIKVTTHIDVAENLGLWTTEFTYFITVFGR